MKLCVTQTIIRAKNFSTEISTKPVEAYSFTEPFSFLFLLSTFIHKRVIWCRLVRRDWSGCCSRVVCGSVINGCIVGWHGSHIVGRCGCGCGCWCAVDWCWCAVDWCRSAVDWCWCAVDWCRSAVDWCWCWCAVDWCWISSGWVSPLRSVNGSTCCGCSRGIRNASWWSVSCRQLRYIYPLSRCLRYRAPREGLFIVHGRYMVTEFSEADVWVWQVLDFYTESVNHNE
jgi:hypothetical protein